jgi:hypothetical protein
MQLVSPTLSTFTIAILQGYLYTAYKGCSLLAEPRCGFLVPLDRSTKPLESMKIYHDREVGRLLSVIQRPIAVVSYFFRVFGVAWTTC